MSPECRDLVDQLLQTDPDMRLGNTGSRALKEHPWFAGLDWDNLARAKAAFVPQLDCESDTSYFDAKEVCACAAAPASDWNAIILAELACVVTALLFNPILTPPRCSLCQQNSRCKWADAFSRGAVPGLVLGIDYEGCLHAVEDCSMDAGVAAEHYHGHWAL